MNGSGMLPNQTLVDGQALDRLHLQATWPDRQLICVRSPPSAQNCYICTVSVATGSCRDLGRRYPAMEMKNPRTEDQPRDEELANLYEYLVLQDVAAGPAN